MTILRIQDHKGRGPWKPGFSESWVDAWRQKQLPPIYDDLPGFMRLVSDAHSAGLHIGCAARGRDGLLAWFSPMEILRLSDLGYGIVDASGCEILAETPHQVLIGSRQPLRHLPSYDLRRAA